MESFLDWQNLDRPTIMCFPTATWLTRKGAVTRVESLVREVDCLYIETANRSQWCNSV